MGILYNVKVGNSFWKLFSWKAIGSIAPKSCSSHSPKGANYQEMGRSYTVKVGTLALHV